MNSIKSLMLVVATLFAMSFAQNVSATESLPEKADAQVNNTKRSVKKGVNRVKEAVCMESDTKCLMEKAKHRAEEGGDYLKDKAKEAKNAVDSNDDANK